MRLNGVEPSRPQSRPATLSIADVAGYLQAHLGQRIAAHLVGLRDAKQVGRYRRENGPEPNQSTELRLREGYKVVRMIVEAFDEKTAKAWLFGTNTRLDDEAPVDVLLAAKATMVLTCGRYVAAFSRVGR